MKRRRHTPELIVRKLRDADRLLAEGREVPEVAKQLEVSEATYHRWRAQYGGLQRSWCGEGVMLACRRDGGADRWSPAAGDRFGRSARDWCRWNGGCAAAGASL